MDSFEKQLGLRFEKGKNTNLFTFLQFKFFPAIIRFTESLMYQAILLLGVAVAMLDCSPVRFETGKEYEYEYTANLSMKDVDEFRVYAKVYLTPMSTDQEGQEIAMQVKDFYFDSTSNKGGMPYQHAEKPDLTGWFSFVVTSQGEITDTYYDENEDNDILAIKKGIATMMSGKFLDQREAEGVDENGKWFYKTVETGHEGEHNAAYSAEALSHGKMYTKKRTKYDRVPSHAESSSIKKVLVDHELGTIRTVTSHEHVEVTTKAKPGFDPYKGMRKVKPVSDFESTVLPTMRAESKGHLRFVGITDLVTALRKPENVIRHTMSHDLTYLALQRSKLEENTTTLQQRVQDKLKCIKQQPSTGTQKLLDCSKSLVEALLALPDGEVTGLVDHIFHGQKNKLIEDTIYKSAILDSLFMMGTPLSQTLIVKYTLEDPTVSRDLVRRSLFHLGSLEATPCEDLLRFFEMMLNKDVDRLTQQYGSENFHIMLLTLGSLSGRWTSENGRALAMKFNTKVKDLLGVHDPYSYRRKRSTMTEKAAMEFDFRKVVYLEALGNEGHHSSFEHIVSHVNSSSSSWIKRSAMHALRKYSHGEAADAILTVAMEEESSEVRREAILEYEAHPAAKLPVPAHLERKKRGLSNKKFEWKLEVPGIDYRNFFGSKELGAAFGVVMINYFDLLISYPVSHFHTEVHDEVYARAVLGIFGITFDFFSARVCFKGGAEYHLNLLQDYDPSLNLEQVALLTEGLRDVAQAIKAGIDVITLIINGNFSMKMIVEDFRAVFKELPNMVLEVRDAALEAAEDFGQLVQENIPPFLQPMRDLIDYVTNLLSDIKLEVMDFYYLLVQSVETTIPRAVEQIFTSVKDIILEFPNLFKNPKKSVARIGGGVLGIGISIAELRIVKEQIMGSSFVKGEKPDWMDLESVFQKIVEMTKKAFESLWNGADEWIQEVKEADDPIDELTNGKMSQALIREMILDRIHSIVERLMAPFEKLKTIGNGFIEKFFEIFQLVTEIREGFEKAKTGYKAARALIDKIFGPKFDSGFPKLVRTSDDCPKNGFYPSKNDPYEYDGVDLLANENSVIVAPLSGVIQRTGRYGQARLSDIEELPVGHVILIDNVELDDPIYNPQDSLYTKTQVSAGERIGTARKSLCTNHIHVVMLDEDGRVIDPSNFVPPRPPERPEWKQYCNDKRVVLKGDVVLVEPFVPGIEVTDTSETLIDDGFRPDAVDESKEPTITDSKMHVALSSSSNKRSFLDQAGHLMETLIERTKAFLENFSLRRIKLGPAVEFLHNLGLTDSVQKIAGILKTIKEVLDDKRCLAPSEMTDDELQTELMSRGLHPIQDRKAMIETLTKPDTRCPYIAMALKNHLNMHCFYGMDCLEMECCTTLVVTDLIQITYKGFIRIDTEKTVVYVGFGEWRHEFSYALDHHLPSEEKTIDTGIQFELLYARLMCKYILETSTHQLTFTFGCGLFSEDDKNKYFSFVYIVQNAVFSIPYLEDDGTLIIPEVDFDSYFDKEEVKEQLDDAGEELLDEVAYSLGDRLLEFLNIPKEYIKDNPECMIPVNMDQDELTAELKARELSVDGDRDEMEERLVNSDTSCTTNTNRTINFPTITNEVTKKVFTYSVSKQCMRIDACLDVYIPIFDVTKTFTAAIELKPCEFVLRVEIENYSKDHILIKYDWNKESRLRLSDNIYLRYTLDKDEDEFILTVALVAKVTDSIDFDSTFIDSLHIPIPICNENFKLPGSGDLQALAEAMGGALSEEAFDVFTQVLGIDFGRVKNFVSGKGLSAKMVTKEILQDEEKCVSLEEPENCDVNATDYIPEVLKGILHCKMLDNCWGVSCCLEFDFDIPFSTTTMNVSIPIIFKYDPCQYYVQFSVGSTVNKTRWLVQYDWGNPNTFTIGKGSVAPITILYTVAKAEDVGFYVDVKMNICLPMGTETFCIPDNGTLHLIDNEHIPICLLDPGFSEDKYPDFSLTEWLTERGRDITDTLGEAGKDYIMEALGLKDVVLETSCNRAQPPFSPSLNGINYDCSTSHILAFNLPEAVSCHIAADCKNVSCCIDVPLIDLSIMVSIDLDLCNNEIVSNLESVSNHIESALSGYKWGERKTVKIGEVFKFSYTVRKPSTNTYVFDADFKACFERDGSCLLDLQLIRNLELPRIFCRSTEAVDEKLKEMDHQCSVDADLQGITCNVETNTDSDDTEIYFRFEPCLDQYIIVVDDKRWDSQLTSLSFDMEYNQDIDELTHLLYTLEDSPTSYYASISLKICTEPNDAQSCNTISVLDMFPLYKVDCSLSEKRKRKRRSLDQESEDIQSAMKEFYKGDYTSEEINAYLKDMSLQEELLREENFEPFPIEDSDMETGMLCLVKSLGKRNPMSIMHSNQKSAWEWEADVTGGQAILDLLNDTITTVGKGSQLYVAGSGLTDYGVQLLGKQLANMTIGDLEAFLELNRIDPLVIHQLITDLVDLAKSLYAETIHRLTTGQFGNAFESFDLVLRGYFTYPMSVGTIFRIPTCVVPLGPVFMSFGFGSNYFLTIDVGIGIRVMSMVADANVAPNAGMSVWGGASFGFILYAEIHLSGYIMDVRFPTYAELDFSRFPIKLGLKMDLVIVPFRMVLIGKVTLKIRIPFCCSFRKTLYSKELWKFVAKVVNQNIINNEKCENDPTPPVLPVPQSPSNTTCKVKQVAGLDYTEPAFEIQMDAKDDKSQVKFFLDVGTYPGGSDVLHEFQLGGGITKLSMLLKPTGVPLYFTMHAQNSQGLRTTATCSLKTYDVTIPTGRVTDDFLTSSNPHVLGALVKLHDDSDLKETNAAIGYGEGLFGDQIVPWHSIQVQEVTDTPAQGTNSDDVLKQFSGMTNGRLLAEALYSRTEVYTVQECAQWCLTFSEYSCLGINYDFGTSRTCEIMQFVQGHDHIIVQYGFFGNYERLGTGLSVEVRRTNLNLEHNFLYKINIDLVNSLEYNNTISSEGILIDLTPPEPGFVNNTEADYLEKVTCESLIPDDRADLLRFCTGTEHGVMNHRLVVDGPTSATVFNGNEELVDQPYTRVNTFVAVNWDGFRDNETSIRLYTVAVGTEICGDQIFPHQDPHRHLPSPHHWNHKAQIYLEHPLPDGWYYITVRALNGVEYGGPLATSACHSTPYTVDNTPPLVGEISNIKYVEETSMLTADIDIRDPLSGISEYDICLGKTSHDCAVLPWYRYNFEDHPSISHHFQLPDGVTSYLRVRAINNVQLRTVGVSHEALLIDDSGPIAGIVYDGQTPRQDLSYSKDNNQICANWEGFYDPESGISEYLVGFGTEPGQTDTIKARSIDYREHTTCLQVSNGHSLVHGATYYSKAYAINGGIIKRNASVVSNGVTIDLTAPEAGEIVDGNMENFEDVQYSSSETTVSSQWRDFKDPDSGIADYSIKIQLQRSGESTILKNWTSLGPDKDMVVWRNFHLEHADFVQSVLKVENGATDTITQITDGFEVDLTAPSLNYIHDGADAGTDIQYQSDTSKASVNFDIIDPESGLKTLHFQIYERQNGNRKRIWPVNTEWYEETDTSKTWFTADNLSLVSGAKYTFIVAAKNKAGISTIHETNGFILDATLPSIPWLHVGVFSGEDEDTLEGYVYQADHGGIKISYLALDPQSGITEVIIKVGTSQGFDDIKSATIYGPTVRDLYIESLNLTDTNIESMSPVYYVTIQVKNGAGEPSDEVSSTPIVVVPEDVPGNVVDGIVSDGTAQDDNILLKDIDYSINDGLLKITFDRFISTLHGIETFVWAVGTSPDTENVLPFTDMGVSFHKEFDSTTNSVWYSGTAHLPVTLEQGHLYYVTLRGVTYGGHALQSITDGILIDKTSPSIAIQRILDHDDIDKDESVLYETAVNSLSATWTYEDPEVISPDNPDNIGMVTAAVGTVPGGMDVLPTRYWLLPDTNFGELPELDISSNGLPNFLTLSVENKCGLSTSLMSPAIVVDSTNPKPGQVTCSQFIQPKVPIQCKWSNFADTESPITQYKFFLGSDEGSEDILAPVTFPASVQEYEINAEDIPGEHGDVYFATVTAVNSVNKEVSAFSNAIFLDNTPPTTGTVVELGQVDAFDSGESGTEETLCNSDDECLDRDITCQTSLTSVTVSWSPFDDSESGIHLYYIAVGTTESATDIMDFKPLYPSARTYTVKGLNLMGKAKIHAKIMAVNGAGLSSVATSNGVYISYMVQGLSPLSPVELWDVYPGIIGDVDAQDDTSTFYTEWDISGEPCPAARFEWKIVRLDGEVVQDYRDVSGSEMVFNDQLDMKNGETYYSLLRVTNVDGSSYIVRSDGNTIESGSLLQGIVYDGDVLGYDLNVLPSKSAVSCNWDGFGKRRVSDHEDVVAGNKGSGDDQEVPGSQTILYYEVALGTDRRFPVTRTDIVPFTNVGTNTSYIFENLDLVPGTATYYFTVRATGTYSSAQAISNGFQVSYDGGVTAGRIVLPLFISTHTTLTFAWEDFSSKEEIMLYYMAVSSHYKPTFTDCKQYVDGGNVTENTKRELFDVTTVTNVGENTFAELTNLELQQGHMYFIFVMGVDHAGECNMTVSNTTVDTTEPDRGLITGGPYFNMTMSFTPSSYEISVKWTGYQDDVSSIQSYRVSLWYGLSCENDTIHGQIGEEYTLDKDVHSFTFGELSLNSKTPYFVKLVVTNGAELTIEDMTEPILRDTSTPTAGTVVEGPVFMDDVVWWGSTSQITGTILYYPNPIGDPCPRQTVPMTDPSWLGLEGSPLLDDDNLVWNIIYKKEFVTVDELDILKIKMSRDSKSVNMLSGGYYRHAEFVDTGTYKFSLKAASEENASHRSVVTEMLFMDDLEFREIKTYYYSVGHDWSEEDCSCCMDDSQVEACLCSDCFGYLQSLNEAGDEEEVSRLDRKQACGFQIYAGLQSFGVLWCQFEDYAIPVMKVIRNLPVDVSASFHTYSFNFFEQREDSSTEMCLNILMDDSQIGSLCGIPHLGSSTKLLIHVWNRDRYYQTSHDPLYTWSAQAEVASVEIPPPSENLCRYGSPFRGGANPINRFEAAVGSGLGLSDLQPYTEVLSPCLPCTDVCSQYICDPNCYQDELSQLVFTLENLDLPSLKQGENVSELVLIYLTVKAVLGSGSTAVSSSNGFYVDSTSPVFDEDQPLLYMDVRQGPFTPVKYQGSNNTIKAVWFCSDEQSEITEYLWAIGSGVGFEDIQAFTSTKTNSTGINTDLEGVLVNNHTYYVSVICKNEAGLETTYQDTEGVIVLTEAPDPDSGGGSIVEAEPFEEDINPPDALKTSDPSTIGARFEIPDGESIDRCDFCLGSSFDFIDDILPCTWVGHNESGEVKIVDGNLMYNGQIMYNLNELKQDSTASSTGGKFLMEPGRIIFMSLDMCNKATLCSLKRIGTVTIVTEQSTQYGVADGTHSISLPSSSDEGGRKRRAVDSVTIQITTPSDIPVGTTVLLVSLSSDDLLKDYTSSASSQFVPYIVNPNITFNSTERLLYGRLEQLVTSFSVVSVAQVTMTGPLLITFTQTNANPLPGEMISELVHWNTVDQEWQTSSLTCQYESDTVTQNEENGTTTVKVCNTRYQGESAELYFKEETQFAIALTLADVINNAPVLTSPSQLSFNEDEVNGFTSNISSEDPEGDEVGFSMLNYSHSNIVENLEISANGSLTFELCLHCYGTITLEVEIYDIPQSPDVPRNSTNVTIDITINAVNDPPNIFLVNDDKQYLLNSNDITQEVQVFLDNAAGLEAYYTSIVGAYDYDSEDTLEIIHSLTGVGTLTVEVLSGSYQSLLHCTETLCLGKSPEVSPSLSKWIFARITYRKSVNFTGTDTAKLVIRDSSGILSDVVTISVYNLEHPCLNGGSCSANTDLPCNNTARLTNFDENYSCVCPISWQGTHCDQDVDECLTSPCGSIYECVNTAGSHNCKIALYFIIPVVIGPVILLIILAACYILCHYCKNRVRQFHPPNTDTNTDINLEVLNNNPNSGAASVRRLHDDHMNLQVLNNNPNSGAASVRRLHDDHMNLQGAHGYSWELPDNDTSFDGRQEQPEDRKPRDQSSNFGKHELFQNKPSVSAPMQNNQRISSWKPKPVNDTDKRNPENKSTSNVKTQSGRRRPVIMAQARLPDNRNFEKVPIGSAQTPERPDSALSGSGIKVKFISPVEHPLWED